MVIEKKTYWTYKNVNMSQLLYVNWLSYVIGSKTSSCLWFFLYNRCYKKSKGDLIRETFYNWKLISSNPTTQKLQYHTGSQHLTRCPLFTSIKAKFRSVYSEVNLEEVLNFSKPILPPSFEFWNYWLRYKQVHLRNWGHPPKKLVNTQT